MIRVRQMEEVKKRAVETALSSDNKSVSVVQLQNAFVRRGNENGCI
jgi:hypothetical protein